VPVSQRAREFRTQTLRHEMSHRPRQMLILTAMKTKQTR